MSRLKFYLTITFALLLLWGGASWYLAQASRSDFDRYVTGLQVQNHRHFFEVEVDEYKENLLGAEALVTVSFFIPSWREVFGDVKLRVMRRNGPFFISDTGIEFGAARWVISLDQGEDEPLINPLETVFNGESPNAVIRFGFFEHAHLSIGVKHIRGSGFSAEDVLIQAIMNLNDGSYELEAHSKQNNYSLSGLSISFPESDIVIERSNSTLIDFKAINAELSDNKNQKKYPMSLSSRGSLRFINDTLSGDWQLLVEAQSIETAQKLFVNLQFKDWLAEGFQAYWQQQAKIASLDEQANWALEEGAETPEEQDFIMSLYSEAERIKPSHPLDIVKSMLKYQRSQMSLNAQLKSTGDVLGQLIIDGTTEGSPLSPMLTLSGEVGIQRAALNESMVSMLDRLSRKLWLRNYETAFEAEVALRNGQLQLNNLWVSWADLSSELKQLFTDQ